MVFRSGEVFREKPTAIFRQCHPSMRCQCNLGLSVMPLVAQVGKKHPLHPRHVYPEWVGCGWFMKRVRRPEYRANG
jgi:hypothetical protein